MAVFGQQKVEPKDILGMEQDEFKKKLDSAATKDDLTTLSQSVEGFKTGLDELKAALKALKPSEPAPIIEDPTDPTTRLLLDPQKEIREVTRPLAEDQMRTRAELQEMRARQNPKLAGAFSKYGDEIMQMAEKMPLSQRAQPGFWEWHVRTFIGDKALSGKIDRDSYPSLIGSSTVGASLEGRENDPNQGFEPVVADWLKGRNIPLPQARKIQNIMGRDGDPITLQNYKGGNA